MPRRKPKDELELDAALRPDVEQEVIDEFFDEVAPTAAYIEIFRLKDDGRRPQLGRVTVDILRDDPYAYLRDKYGKGRYMLMGKTSGHQFIRSKTLEVETDNPLSHTAAAATNGNTLDRDLMLALIANLRPAPAPDMGSLLQGLAAMQPKAPDLTGMLTAMVTVFTALKPSEHKDDMLEKLPKVLEIVKAFTPEGGPREENLYTVAKDIGNKLVDAIKPRPQLPEPGNVTLQGNEPMQPAPTPDPETMLQQWLAYQLKYLKAKARAGKDAADFAEFIVDNDEEPGNNAILTALERGATFEHLCQFDPEIGQDPILNTWFRNLYEALQQAMSSPDEGAPDSLSGGSDGNPSDPSTDGVTSASTVVASPRDGRSASKRGQR